MNVNQEIRDDLPKEGIEHENHMHAPKRASKNDTDVSDTQQETVRCEDLLMMMQAISSVSVGEKEEEGSKSMERVHL